MPRPVTKPRSRSLKSAQPELGHEKGKSAFSFKLDGQETRFKTGKELMVAIFCKFAERDPTFCRRYSEQEYGRSRKYVARVKGRSIPELSQRPDQRCCRAARWVVDRDSLRSRGPDETDRGGLQGGQDRIRERAYCLYAVSPRCVIRRTGGVGKCKVLRGLGYGLDERAPGSWRTTGASAPPLFTGNRWTTSARSSCSST